MGRISTDKSVSSQDMLFGAHTIIHDGEPYMTRFWFWRFRIHRFHRGDKDQDCHDHPWDFWTFPLTSYVEEVLYPVRETVATVPTDGRYMVNGETYDLKAGDTIPMGPPRYYTNTEIVRAFRLHRRRAEHAHRVLGAWNGQKGAPGDGTKGGVIAANGYDLVEPGKKIVTLVYQGGVRRKWGFYKHRAGKWCWEFWKKYALEGGRDQPCS